MADHINEHIKKDFTLLTTLYGVSAFFIVLVALFAVPLAVRESGIFSPLSDKVGSFRSSAFDEVEVHAISYIVYDVLSGEVIAGKNHTLAYPLASITKVMTALTAVHVAPKDTLIVVSKKSVEDGYDLGLKSKQVWTLENLLKYTLVFSSNDGAQLVADSLLGRTQFVKKMNTYAQELGLNMQFTQPAGLDEGGKLGGVGSAYEVAKMMVIARSELDDIMDPTTKTRATVISSNGPIRGIPNTNQYIDQIVGAEASKTGFTESAGGNLVISVDVALGHPVIIVVLGSTREARFTDAYQLYLALLKSLEPISQ